MSVLAEQIERAWHDTARAIADAIVSKGRETSGQRAARVTAVVDALANALTHLERARVAQLRSEIDQEGRKE